MYIIANWKLNGDINLLKDMFDALNDDIIGENTVILSLPYTMIDRAVTMNVSKKIFIASQDVSAYEHGGAYTGEVSATMLKDIGCQYCLVGHSERKKHFHETTEDINNKLLCAIRAGLKPILCIGENSKHNYVEEINIACSKLSQIIFKSGKVIIAYEPVWAIGNNIIPTINDINSSILEIVEATFTTGSFVYGGSVTEDNVSYLTKSNMINGFLIGGASLNVKRFIQIIERCKQ